MNSDLTSPPISKDFLEGSHIQEKQTKKGSYKSNETDKKTNALKKIFSLKHTESVSELAPLHRNPHRNSLRFFSSHQTKNLNLSSKDLENLSIPEIVQIIVTEKEYFAALQQNQKIKLLEYLLSPVNDIAFDLNPIGIFRSFFDNDQETPIIIEAYRVLDGSFRKKILKNISINMVFQVLNLASHKEISYAINHANSYEYAEAIFNFVSPEIKNKVLFFYDMNNPKFTKNLNRNIQKYPYKIALAFREKWILDDSYLKFIQETAIFKPGKIKNAKGFDLPYTLSTYLESRHWVEIIDILDAATFPFLRRENYLTTIMESLAIGEMSLFQFKNYINTKKTAPWLQHKQEFLIQTYTSKINQEHLNRKLEALETKIDRLQSKKNL